MPPGLLFRSAGGAALPAALISRSGDECVVALCDQWYLDYGEEKWRQVTQNCLDKLECYHDEVKKNFASTLDWLIDIAAHRQTEHRVI